MEKITLRIATPYGRIYDGEVKYVIVPGSEGEFGVFPGHCDLLSLLKIGIIEFESIDGDKGFIAINWGHAQVSQAGTETHATMMAGAVAIDGNTESAISSAIESTKALLEGASDDTSLVGMVVSRVENIAKSRI